MAGDDNSTLSGPAACERLIGHKMAQASFLQSVDNKTLHHAWLLTGPEGVGKASFAWLAAKHLLTADAKDDGPGLFGDAAPAIAFSSPLEEPDVHRIAEGGHSDLRVLTRQAHPKTGKLKTEITIDQVQALQSLFTMSSGEGGWRITLIDSIDDLNRSAANALLKILEEPPERSLFLLVSHQPGRLLPTIKSRCRQLTFSRLSEGDMQQYLEQAGMAVDPVIAALAEGCPGRAAHLASLNASRVLGDMADIALGHIPLPPAQLKPYQTSEEASDFALEMLQSLFWCAAGARAPAPIAEKATPIANKIAARTLDEIGGEIAKMARQQKSLRMDRGFFWLTVGEVLRHRLSAG